MCSDITKAYYSLRTGEIEKHVRRVVWRYGCQGAPWKVFGFHTVSSGASRIRAGQGICVLRQGILGHFRPLLDIFGAKGLFKDTFLFGGQEMYPPP